MAKPVPRTSPRQLAELAHMLAAIGRDLPPAGVQALKNALSSP